MRLSYLGDRDYIDISQISKFFFLSKAFQSLGVRDSSVSGFKVRMLNAIKHHCWIEKAPLTSIEPVCRVEVEQAGRRDSFFLIEDLSSPILEREPEPEPDMMSLIQEDDSRYWIDGPVDYFWVYIYTQLGKHLMNRRFGALKPKASGYAVSRIPSTQERSFFMLKNAQHRGPFVFMEGGSEDRLFVKTSVREFVDS